MASLAKGYQLDMQYLSLKKEFRGRLAASLEFLSASYWHKKSARQLFTDPIKSGSAPHH